MDDPVSLSPAGDAVRACEVVVHGRRVQGVFFRDSCRAEADAVGVAGWVSNDDDGTVHTLLEGPLDAVAAMLVWVGHGPPRAEVSSVDVVDVEPAGRDGFEVR